MSTEGPKESLASSTAEQVRSIIEAAEHSAAEIKRQATAEAEAMLARIEAMRGELRKMLEGPVPPVAGIATGETPRVSEPVAAEPEPVAPQPESAAAAEPAVAGEPVGAGEPSGAPAPWTATDPAGEAAKLIATNMALNGSSREETERYLEENYSSLQDRTGLLDQVYASIQG